MRLKKIKIPSVVILLSVSLAGFVIGILFMALRHENWIMKEDLFNEDFIYMLEKVQVDKTAFFFLCLFQRMKCFLMLFLLAFSTVNVLSNLMFFSVYGFFAGSVLELLVIRYGVQGMWMYLFMTFPQSILYFAGFVQLGCWCLNMENKEKYHRLRKIKKLKEIKEKKKILSAICLILFGCFTEGFLDVRKVFFLFWKI